jgi:large subunit ribosomal protein L6
VRVKGPKGELTTPLPQGIKGEVKDGALLFTRRGDSKRLRAFHGLARALAANAVTGVSQGFQRDLEIVGIGYRAQVKGGAVLFSLGYSHPVDFPIPEGISIEVDGNTKIKVTGADKQQVGQVAAQIRELRPPDPYKGKGIRYKGEILRLKVGKAAVGGTK